MWKLPTHGHTPGHQSLRVRTETGGEFILCGDACYLRDTLEKLHLPSILVDKEAFLSVLGRLRGMQARGSKIIFGHDPVSGKPCRRRLRALADTMIRSMGAEA